jgi:DNA-binding NtrC family response regulator
LFRRFEVDRMADSVLVVDDQEQPRMALVAELVDAGFDVFEASDGAQAWALFRRVHPDLVVTDMVMPNSDGMELLSRVRKHSEVPVIVFTAFGSVDTAVAALKAGADEFVASSNLDLEELIELIRGTLARHAPSGRDEPAELLDRLPGKSRAIRRLRGRVSALGRLSNPVLVTGEPGTGRDTVVEALHDLGSTGGRSLARIDAASFGPRDPIPERGAVYLDGVENLRRETQRIWSAYLSRDQVGAKEGARVFVSASDGLAVRMTRGNFDHKLGNILLRFQIQVPPLRERQEDVPDVAGSMVNRLAAELGRRQVRLSAPALELLAGHRWPGNLRQLERVLERAVAFSKGREIRREVVEEVLGEIEESVASIRERHSIEERDALLGALRDTGGNVSQTAEILGKSRPAIYRLIEKYEIPLARRSP